MQIEQLKRLNPAVQRSHDALSKLFAATGELLGLKP
jgi:hypothetical protein